MVSKRINIIGGKQYDWGNYIIVQGRNITIEFDSDYYICKTIHRQNYKKGIEKEIEKIPGVVTLEWFIENGWEVEDGCFKARDRRV